MKKKYMEPQMIVEDFTVSEMVAADCKLAQTQVTFVKQMNSIEGYACNTGNEKYFKDDPSGMRGAEYDKICGLFDGNFDMDHDGAIETSPFPNMGNNTSDTVFTPGFRLHSGQNSHVPESVCDIDGSGLTFDTQIADIQCTTDTSLLQNS